MCRATETTLTTDSSATVGNINGDGKVTSAGATAQVWTLAQTGPLVLLRGMGIIVRIQPQMKKNDGVETTSCRT